MPADLVDPYAYDGPWPPDPSWDDPLVPTPEEAPVPDIALVPPADSPATAQARAAADALFADQAPAVQLGQPRPVAAPVVDPIDEGLITMGDGEPEAPPLDTIDPYAEAPQVDAVTGGQVLAGAAEAPAPVLDAYPLTPDEQEQQRFAGLSGEDLALEQFRTDQDAEAQAAEGRMAAQRAAHDGQRRAEDAFRSAMKAAADERAQI